MASQQLDTSVSPDEFTAERVNHYTDILKGKTNPTRSDLDSVEAEIVSLENLIDRSLRHLDLLKNIRAYLNPKEVNDVTRITGDGIDDTLEDQSNLVTWEGVTRHGDWDELYPGEKFYTTQKAAEMMGKSQKTVLSWIKNGKLLGLQRNGSREYRLPSMQFIDGKPLDSLSEVISAVGDPDSAWHFLRVPQYLDKKALLPIDVLRSGDKQQIKTIISIAECFGCDFT